MYIAARARELWKHEPSQTAANIQKLAVTAQLLLGRLLSDHAYAGMAATEKDGRS
jgi:hypothetical protein